jgi:hypothetical protein
MPRGSRNGVKGSPSKKTASASQLIDARIKELDDWRGELLSRLRALIREAAPGVVEDWKWRGTPVWLLDGMICTGETYKDHVKVTFAKGASMSDPDGLFTQNGTVRRAIDFHEGEKVKEGPFKSLVRAAVALNRSSASRPRAGAGWRETGARAEGDET